MIATRLDRRLALQLDPPDVARKTLACHLEYHAIRARRASECISCISDHEVKGSRALIRARRASECVPVVTIDPLAHDRLTESNALARASGSCAPADTSPTR